jgi:putative peptide zinc metalloprotease protein
VEITRDRVSLWEALAGRAPGRPTGPADPDLWDAVVERLNPARGRPVLRPGIERARLTSLRGEPYVMLRSPDRESSYIRLSPEEVELSDLMDGSRTVAQLVREFVGISGRLAPEQVTRTVADLAANRMLAELPLNALRAVETVRRRRGLARAGHGLLEAAKGRRIVLADFDRPAALLYRAGGRLLFTRAAAVVVALVALAGIGLFGATWFGGAERLFVTADSYAAGGALLLGLNIVALVTHELGHALAVKHAGRRVPAIGFLFYFGIPSAFVDTTDVWMKGRRARLLTSAAGPVSALTMAGVLQLIALVWPELSPIAFRLAFMWYLNALFNLNPLMALDGYYLAMDWLEIPNLRARGIAALVRSSRSRSIGWARLDREGRFVTMYGFLAALWMVVFLGVAVRLWRDRVSGLLAGLWHAGWVARGLVVVFLVGLSAPLVYASVGWLGHRAAASRRRRRERAVVVDAPNRLAALRSSRLGSLPSDALAGLAEEARWVHPRRGSEVVRPDEHGRDVLVVVEGALEGRHAGDLPGTLRARVRTGELVGVRAALAGEVSAMVWVAAGTRLLRIPASAFARIVGPLVGPVPPDRTEAKTLVERAPALVGLDEEQTEALFRRMEPIELAPRETITVSDPARGVLLASGSLSHGDDTVSVRGDLLAPSSPRLPIEAVARTSVQAWVLPGLDRLTLFGAGGPAANASGRGPRRGAHGGTPYVPLAVAPAASPLPGDDSVDRRLHRHLAWLIALASLFALLAIPFALLPATGWAELPDDRAVLEVVRGEAELTSGEPRVIAAGTRLAVGPADRIRVGDRSLARITYAGGATQTMCPGTLVELGAIGRDAVPGRGQPHASRVRPSGELTLVRGRVLADTSSDRSAFLPLHFVVTVGARQVTTSGEVSFALDPARLVVERGTVQLDGAAVAPGGGTGGCNGVLAAGGVPLLADRATSDTEVAPTPRSLVPPPRGLAEVPAARPGPIPEVDTAPEGGPDGSATQHEAPDPPADGDAAAEPGSGPATDTEPDPVGQPDPDPEPDQEPDPDPDPDLQADPDPDPEPDPDPDPEPVAGLVLTCQPSSLTVARTGSTATSCEIVPTGGFRGLVTLSCADLPTAFRCVWSNGVVDVDGDAVTSRLTLHALEATLGPTSFTVVARSGDITERMTVLVTVTRA